MKRDIPVFHIEFTPVDELLDIWLRFQHRPDSKLGFKRRDTILKSDAAADFQQLTDRTDEQVADGVEACINSLKVQNFWAIMKRCGVATVWNFPRLDFIATLELAEKELEEKLREKPATSNYF